MKLRDYQEECLEVMKQNGNKQLIQLPTGSGKTFIFLKYLRDNSKKALIVVPTLDLQHQTYESALNFFHKSEIFLKDDRNKYFDAKIYIVVAPSLSSEKFRKYIVSQDLDHIIIDEAHKSLCNNYLNFLELYENYNSDFKLIGFTATPERLDRQSLLKVFDKITYKKNIYDMIKDGYLCDVKCFRIHTKNKIESNNKMGDFQPIEIKNLDNASRNHLIYKAYTENCIGKKTLIFCISVEHSQKIAAHLKKEYGIKALSIDGRKSIEERKRILLAFKTGEIDVLTNCQLLTEGFDEPSIEAMIIARPTKSKSLYCQMIGRGVRKFLNKEVCEVYELTDNAHKICTFNVAADDKKDSSFKREYKDGIRLTDLHREISEISLSDYILEKSEVNLISTFEDYLNSEGLLESQIKKLQEKNIEYMHPINFLQAEFLLFLQRLKEKYGYI